MNINEYKIKLCGSANIPLPLVNGKSYDLTIKEAEVRKVEELPNDNGTANQVFGLKISEMSEINIIDGHDIIKSKKKGSMSQKLRFLCNNNADNLGRDREEYYQERLRIYMNMEAELYE